MSLALSSPNSALRAYRVAYGLSLFTIFYNVVEGFTSTWLGFQDETLTLFGFGIDSFIEVASGLGIAHMVLRIQRNPTSLRDDFERNALRVTGFSFYALTAGLLLSAAITVWTKHRPETTIWGFIISVISIVVMIALVWAKERVGRQLNSDAILADANCTRVCIYMSVILLASSGLYYLTGWPYLDAAGTLGLAWFAFHEGREALEKATSEKLCACKHD